MRFIFTSIVLLIALFTSSEHINAQTVPYSLPSPSVFDGEIPDPQNTPWTLYQGDSPIPTPGPSGNTTSNVNAPGLPDTIGADSSLQQSGGLFPKSYDFYQGYVIMGFQPPSSVALINDGNSADGAAELRILARPSNQCFTLGEDYYLPSGFANPPQTHGRLIMIDWCNGGKIVFSKDFGTPTWGVNHNQVFSQAYPNAMAGFFQSARGAITLNSFTAEFYNWTPNLPVVNPVPNPPGEPASGEAVYLETQNPKTNQYYGIFLEDKNGNIITENIPQALLPQSGVTSQYPSARVSYEMSYKNYKGSLTQCPNEPNFGVAMDWYGWNINTGVEWVESEDGKNKFWGDVFSTQNNSINGVGCMWNYDNGGDAYALITYTGYIYLGNLWGAANTAYIGNLTVIPWSTQ